MKRRVGPKLLMAALVVPFALQAPACQNCDTTGQDPIEFSQGITDPSGTTYESTPISGEWLHFPPGRIFELRHELRGCVLSVESYVSFKARLSPEEDDDDTSMDNPNNFSEAAGNQVVYEESHLPNHIRIRNDTCSEFYVRIVATTAPIPDQSCLGGAGGGGAGGAGGTLP